MVVKKTDLINEIAEKAEVSKSRTKAVIDAFWDKVNEHVSAGDEVQFIGIGKFYKAHTNERTGRNPRTGETIKISASDRLAFKSTLKF